MFDGLYRADKIALEVVPQGNLAERMRAAGAGIGAFFCPTGVGTPLAEGKEVRTIDGRDYVLEYPIRGDVALIGAHIGDRAGNLVYRKTARNFGAGDGDRRGAHHRRGVAGRRRRRYRSGNRRHTRYLRRPHPRGERPPPPPTTLYGTPRRIIDSSTTRLWALVRYSTAISRQLMASVVVQVAGRRGDERASSPSSSAW